MPNTSGLRIPLCVAATLAVAFIGAAQDAPKQQFTARELFYQAGDTPAAKPIAKAPAKAAPTAVTKRPPATQVASADSKPTATRPVSRAESATSPDETPIIKASAGQPATAPAPANGPALGLKYTILKRTGNDNVEVPPETVFHAGDRIQFSVQTNGPGYLYIVNQGSSGTWKPIFPSPEVAEGDNHVDGWHAYTMPPKSRMVFDEQTGKEKIFIVFSRDPEPEFENLIYSLQGGKAKPTPAPAKPVSQPDVSPKSQKQMLVVASLNIEDSAVDRMRKTYSRDLLIEKVDDNTPGDRKEKAVYVVNPTGSSEPRVVADLQLVHQ